MVSGNLDNRVNNSAPNTDNGKTDILISEYEQNMTTYRYLTDMTVKYMLVYLGISGFCIKAYLDLLSRACPPHWTDWLLYFPGAVGFYTFVTILMVILRMRKIQGIINDSTAKLGINPQNFGPLFVFLFLTDGLILALTVMTFVLVRSR